MDKGNNASESDLSDEDFCPENEAATDLSEESSDDEIDDDEQTTEDTKNQNKRPRKSKKKIPKSKTIKIDEENQLKRSTRQKSEINEKNAKDLQKDELESDDEEKSRADALWADFLGDVKQTPTEDGTQESKKDEKPANTEKSPIHKTNKTSTITKATINGDKLNGKSEAEEENPKKITITEIMDFAGEEVKIQKVINAESIKENKTKIATGDVNKQTSAAKRSAVPSGSGLGSILNQIGKKKKISVLEKTKLDWNTFKQDEGIDEELQTFNKGKDGYLERQDFLQRTDLRQFEIERNMRQTRRNH